MENKKYIIFDTSELHKVDFSQVLEDSSQTVRKSLDESKTFVNWRDEPPSFLELLTTKEGPYTEEEMLVILSTKEWCAIDHPYYYTQTSIGDTE